jgi:cell surface protein SprA
VWKNLLKLHLNNYKSNYYRVLKRIVRIFSFLLFSLSAAFSLAQPGGTNDTLRLAFPFRDDNGLLYDSTNFSSPLMMEMPESVKEEVVYDPLTGEYVVRRTINGKVDYRPPVRMSLKEYADYDFNKAERNYWSERARSENFEHQGGLIPKLYIGGKLFETIFGSNSIDIKVRGQATLTFAIQYDKTDNFAIPEPMRSNVTFDFDERIQINVNGKIGENLEMEIKYDTEAAFDFENKMNIRYKGDEDDIIQRIEAGNVSLPLASSLIRGNQSLFGVLTELKFGKFNLTTVFSQQKSETKTIEVQGGAQKTEFNIKADEYDENRHYFLNHSFRDNYESALATLPLILSGASIQNIEVWVLNRQGSSDNTRNIIAFLDLAENRQANLQNQGITLLSSDNPRNDANNLYGLLTTNPQIRDISSAANALAELEGQGFRIGRDYEIIENARKLNQSEYRVNTTLGYISLNSQLKSDEVLAVAYKYTYGNSTNSVGEISSDVESPKTLIVKLIKGTSFSPSYVNWNLMMKNVYRLGGFQVNQEDFLLDVVYNDVKTGREVFSLATPNYPEVDGIQFLRMLNLDNLNQQNQRVTDGDGVFDFVPGITMDAQRGLLYFPVLEPFGRYLQKKFGTSGEALAEAEKYVFLQLYDSTKTVARQNTEKNKFRIKGEYKSAGGSEIPLNAMNIPRGSVQVTHGGRQLQENTDFTVDYMMGRLTITNPAIMESGTPVQITLESNNMFSIQTKTLMGAHMTYDFGTKFNMGATILNLRENPLTKKVNIGNEPINNTIWGLNASYKSEVPFLTKLVDKIPLISTKAQSSITVEGEFAHLIPGHNKVIDKEGKAFIDDFEGATSNIDLRQPYQWSVASTPRFFEESNLPPGELNYRRRAAHMSWYIIDPLFYNSGAPVSKAAISSLYTCQFRENQLFPNIDNQQSLYNNISILNLAYYPGKRGTNNYNFDRINSQGNLLEPEQNWGGIQRALTSPDFENLNIEFIEFWMMDPYAEDVENSVVRAAQNPALYINLGDVSEDVLKDGRKSFEQGLPKTAEQINITRTAWGMVSTRQAVTNSFDSDAGSRQYQDLGLDGLNNEDERVFFANRMSTFLSDPSIPQSVKDKILSDPSGDDFRYFRGGAVDNDPLAADNVLERYKYFSGTQNNSPVNSNQQFTPQSTSLPDGEDINGDFTLNQSENYFQYKVDLSPQNFENHKKYIVDEVNVNIKMPNGSNKSVKWYQFKIPIRKPDEKVGEIADFRSIRFMRMFMTGFDEPVVLRFARLNLVRSDWRRYEYVLEENSESLNPNVNLDQTTFEVLTVNIEENASRTPVNYILPPGVDREIDQGGTQAAQLNEQALAMRLIDLPDGYAKAVYKNIDMDMRRYGKLKMFIHAEAMPDIGQLDDNEITVFVRVGTDFRENYYEYEIPVEITRPGNYPDNTWGRNQVWPGGNNLDVSLETLREAKNKRNLAMTEPGSSINFQTEYIVPDGKNRIKVKGNPSLAEVKSIMIGVRNPRNDGMPKSAEVWVNELALTDFTNEGGWAATGRISTQMADFASVTIAGSTSKSGFGSLEQRMHERQMENINQYDISTNVELGKFFPAKANVRLPMYFGYGEVFITPEYNPLDQDIPLDVTLSNPNLTSEQKEELQRIARDYTRRKSLNFTNVKIGKPSPKNYFWEIANWTAGYSFTDIYMQNPNTEYNSQRRHVGTLGYVFNNRPKVIEPLKKVKFLQKKPLTIIREINFSYAPTQLSFTTQVERKYNEMLRRNLNNPNQTFNPSYNKDFRWSRNYNLSYNLSRGIKVDFASNVMARIKEEEGRLDREMSDYDRLRDTIVASFRRLGEISDYNHNLKIAYNIPVNKIPGLGWVTANANYTGQYDWKEGFRENANDDAKYGNQIQNSNKRMLTIGLNFNKLFTSVAYVDQVHKKFKKPLDKRFKEKEVIDVQYIKEKLRIKAKEKRMISHKLESIEVTVELKDKDGNPIKFELNIDNANRISITPETDVVNGTVTVNGKRERSQHPFFITMEYLTRISTGLQNVNFSYNEDRGSILNGYKNGANGILGTSNNFSAPGWGYLFGITDEEYINKVIENQWMSNNITQSIVNPYTLTFANRLTLKATLEPLPELQITLDWVHNSTASETKQYYAINNIFEQDSDGNYSSYNRQFQGNFTHSFNGIRTSFQRVNKKTYRSEALENFMKYRQTVAWEMARHRAVNQPGYNPGTNFDGYPEGYTENSPDVLRNAFKAAFEGTDPNAFEKGPGKIVPSILAAAPNWRIDYKGLSKIKAINKYFRTITLTHAYQSNYTIGSYQSNPEYIALTDGNGYSDILNIEGTYFVPEFLTSSVSFQESFNPLTGINLTWKNGMNTGINFKKDRNVALNLTNSTLTEIRNWDFNIRSGYTIKDVPLVFKTSGGGQRKFVSNVNITGDFSIRNNVTYNHQLALNVADSLSQNVSERIAGKINYAFKVGADYQLNKNLNVRGFYEHTIDKPWVSTSFRTVRAKFGFSINYRLTE